MNDLLQEVGDFVSPGPKPNTPLLTVLLHTHLDLSFRVLEWSLCFFILSYFIKISRSCKESLNTFSGIYCQECFLNIENSYIVAT